MTAAPVTKKRKNIYVLQILRGIAAVLVVLFHMTITLSEASINFLGGFFKFGNSGVEIFFVLSGFIISYTSYKLISTNRIGEYGFKRLVRVYPIYWVVITLFLPAVFLGLNSGYQITAFNLFSTYALLPEHPMINGVSWSLSYELYFYALFALLIISRKFFIVLFVVLIITLLQIFGAVTFENTIFSKFFFSPYVLLFYMGMAVFYVFHKEFWVPESYVCLIGMAICVAAFLVYSQTFHHLPQSPIFYGAVSSIFIFLAVSFETTREIKMPSFPILLGDASYVLYLVHLPVLNFFVKIITKYVSDHTTIILLTSAWALLIIFASIVMHLIIEKPLIGWIRRDSSRPAKA